MKYLTRLIVSIAIVSAVTGCGSFRENVKAWAVAGVGRAWSSCASGRGSRRGRQVCLQPDRMKIPVMIRPGANNGTASPSRSA